MGRWSHLIVALLFAAAVGQVAVSFDYDGDGMTAATELRGPTHAFVADSDNDGLRDDIELNLSTNVIKQDTDGDGLIDGVEVSPPPELSEADPLHKDVFIEVDRARGTEIPREEMRRIQNAFEEAPVQNPSGETGIDVHVYYDDTVDVTNPSVSVGQYFDEYHTEQTFQNKSYGYYHMLLVEDATSSSGAGDGVIGGTLSGEDGFIVERLDGLNRTGATTMHELGHVIGLSSTDFRGIDSRLLTESEYPSVMNYNYRADCADDADTSCPNAYAFSGDDGAYDDWAHIETSFAGPEVGVVNDETRERLKAQDSYAAIVNSTP